MCLHVIAVCWIVFLSTTCCAIAQESKRSEELQELIHFQRELRLEINNLDREKKAVVREFEMVSERVEMQGELEAIRRKLAEAEEANDENTIDRLVKAEQNLERKIDELIETNERKLRESEVAELDRLMGVLKEHGAEEYIPAQTAQAILA